MDTPKVTIPREVFKVRLLAERERLLGELATQTISGAVNGKVVGGEHAGYGNHMADDASEVFEQEKNLALQRIWRSFWARWSVPSAGTTRARTGNARTAARPSTRPGWRRCPMPCTACPASSDQ